MTQNRQFSGIGSLDEPVIEAGNTRAYVFSSQQDTAIRHFQPRVCARKSAPRLVTQRGTDISREAVSATAAGTCRPSR
jgi:hypothetical protein